MSHQYVEGETTGGAADEIIDWFVTFKAWITTVVGWTMANDVSATECILSSPGEAGGLTKLFVRIWRGAGGDINKVYLETQDDVGGTHKTTQDGFIDSGGVQFYYFIAADKDAISIIWKTGVSYRWKYAGLVDPFALTVPDETYQSISASLVRGSNTILRNHDDAWDQNVNTYDNTLLDDARRDRYDNSIILIGNYLGTGLNIAGQLKHVTGEIEDPNVNPEDTVTTGLPGATSTWKVFADSATVKFAMRTGGILPTGVADGAFFAHQSGVATSVTHLLGTIIPAFLVGIGWTNHGDQGIFNFSRLFSSPGESGIDSIYIGYAWQAALTDLLYPFVQDDLAGTHRSNMAACLKVDAADFPTSYWIVGDRDCLLLTVQRGVTYDKIWMGAFQPFSPGLYVAGITPYKMVTHCLYGLTSGHKILREHNGTWSPGGNTGFSNEESTSNPNAFDGVTFHLWPYFCYWGVTGGNEPLGVYKYLFGTKGGGLANLDTITVGAQVFTVFFDTGGNPWAMRTA